MIETGSGGQLGQGLHGRGMKIRHAMQFVRDHKGALARHVLSRHTGRTSVGMTTLRLDAAERKHEATRRIAPVRTQSECARDVERGGDLATGAKLDLITDSNSHQSGVSKG